MKFDSPIRILFIVALLVSGAFGWSLYQWQAQDSAGMERQGDTDRRAAGDWAADQIVDTAPEFTLRDRDGRQRSSDEWEGRIRVVNFWATWCAPCREEVPMLMDLQRDYADKGVTVLGVAVDEPAAAREFADEFDINYPVLVGEESARDLAAKFGSDQLGLPHTIIVNRENRVVGFHLGLMTREDIMPLLESVLSDSGD